MTEIVPFQFNTPDHIRDQLRVLSEGTNRQIKNCVEPILIRHAGQDVTAAQITLTLLNAIQSLITRDLITAEPASHMPQAAFFAHLLVGYDKALRERAMRAYEAITEDFSKLVMTRLTLRTSTEMRQLLLQSERNKNYERFLYPDLLTHAGSKISLLEAVLLVLNSIDAMVANMPEPDIAVVMARDFYYNAIFKRNFTHSLVADNESANQINDLLRIVIDT
jgi:hypothetical protein